MLELLILFAQFWGALFVVGLAGDPPGEDPPAPGGAVCDDR